MPKKAPSAAQLRARADFARRFGGKRSKSSKSQVNPTMANKSSTKKSNRKRTAPRSGARARARKASRRMTIAIGPLVPILKMGSEVMFGETGRYGGARDVFKAQGLPKAVERAVRIAAFQVSGYHGGVLVQGDNNKWNLVTPLTNVGLALVGRQASKTATKWGVNNALAKVTNGRLRI